MNHPQVRIPAKPHPVRTGAILDAGSRDNGLLWLGGAFWLATRVFQKLIRIKYGVLSYAGVKFDTISNRPR